MDNHINTLIYTFNYDGRNSSSFSHALNGLEKMLKLYDSIISLNILFSSSNFNETQKNEIDNMLINYSRKPIFHNNRNTEKDIA